MSKENDRILEFTEESIHKAIERIESNPKLLQGRKSMEYDLVLENGKRYPPILVLSEAHKILGGKELTLKDFHSTKEAFKNFQKFNFQIESKSFFNYLKGFIETANTQNIGKGTNEKARIFNRNLIKTYKSLDVDASFGIGRATATAWISFLGEGQKTKNGIYPVYLYYIRNNLLILAYGISQDTAPPFEWQIPNATKISDFFEQNNLGKPKDYGESLVFKTYNPDGPLVEKEMNKDLDSLIEIYNQTLKKQHVPQATASSKTSFDYKAFYKAANDANFVINDNLCTRFCCSLLTKPFVILTGLSGSGKTKLAQAFANWMCKTSAQICIVPVGADWTNRDPLLGYPSALELNRYMLPENGALQLIINAQNNSAEPHFLILDEMNLSHVERYFADFLSVMESKQSIALHSGESEIDSTPPKLKLPNNLFIIGTVNIDETTYMFSPKVLDRANVIEFRVEADEMESFLSNGTNVTLEDLVGQGVNMAAHFLSIALDKKLATHPDNDVTSDLVSFFRELKKAGAEFGYRTASEIMRFSAVVNTINQDWNKEQILDAAIMQKLLPKVHGSQRKLTPVLRSLAELCLHDKALASDFLNPKKEVSFENDKIKYPTSLEKIRRMQLGLVNNGFTSYAEA